MRWFKSRWSVILGFEIDHSFSTCKKQLKEYGFEVSKISMKEKILMFSKKQLIKLE